MRDWRLVLRDAEREEARKRALVKNVPGEIRNQKCPCGSGRKAKNCECDMFKGISNA
ncbi:SEC-C metal-binding domain-containing protein [Raoultella ornithinolytica]|uniref:SEC-C metal-binding domain-containing protein n=1 Tax=Raoultella ornithinolytica TaxID=54291 RepID=UPI002936C7BC|nr:SEC-C domain-containing protein [Raoultella ornithinolytica]HEC2631894.1 SEC-C domain-containing protein [Raoultella ornithinolytica]